MPAEPMTLQNVGDGMAAQMFEEALRKVRLDLEDGNKVENATRKVVLTVALTPDAGSQALAVVVKCDTKLAPRLGVRSMARLGQRGLLQYRDEQEDLPFNPEDKVRPMQARESGGEE